MARARSNPTPSSGALPLVAARPSGRLTVARLHGERVLGVEDVTIDLDQITVISGANAAGKSSLLKLLRSVLGIDRTALARLARVGPDGSPVEGDPLGEVLLVGDGREVHVTRRGGGSPEVRERVGEDWRVVPRPVEWLRQLVDVEAANPAAWLSADDEERATAVLAAMPLDGYSREEALRGAGLEGFRLPPIPTGLHPLEDLEQVEAAVFNSRTEVNRQARAEADAADKLLAGLPAEAPKDLGGKVAELEALGAKLADEVAREEEAAEAALRAARQAAGAALGAERDRIGAELEAAAAKVRSAHDAQIAELRASLERRISELAAEEGAAIEALQTRREEAVLAAVAVAAEAQEKAQAANRATVAGIAEKAGDLAKAREELAAARAHKQAADTDRHVRRTAEEAHAKAKAHADKAASLTAGIEALKRYRLELAEQLPIRGLAVRFDDKGRKSLTLDGVPLATLNDGRLVELATEVSLLRSRPADDSRPFLDLILLDGIERLDAGRRAALLREVASRGSQIVAAVVGDGPLRALRGEEALAEGTGG